MAYITLNISLVLKTIFVREDKNVTTCDIQTTNSEHRRVPTYFYLQFNICVLVTSTNEINHHFYFSVLIQHIASSILQINFDKQCSNGIALFSKRFKNV